MVRLSPHRARRDIVNKIKHASNLEEKQNIISTQLVFTLVGKNKEFDEERIAVILEGLDREDEDYEEEERYKEWSKQHDRDLDKIRDQERDRYR